VRISICIPTFNRERHLTNCLRPLEICVFDKASGDDAAALIAWAARIYNSQQLQWLEGALAELSVSAEMLGGPSDPVSIVDISGASPH
jgi:glycosyltransferase involved in cell wall biosynthesis